MKRRIEQLLSGKYEYEINKPLLSVERIEQEGQPGDMLTGFFDVNSGSEQKMSGFLYSSNPRVIFDPPQFGGVNNRIVYQADLTGLQAGEAAEGAFTLCTDHGEYSLPYHFLAAGTADGETVDTDAKKLAELAKQDTEQALRVFVDEHYGESLTGEQRILWETLLDRANPERSLEEYLIGCGEKQPVELRIEQSDIRQDAPLSPAKQTICLKKSGWGYLEIAVESDAPFLRVEKHAITTDDFVGDEYVLEYIVDTNFLHAGKNFGRIRITSCYQTVYVDFVLRRERRSIEHISQNRVRKLMQKKLLGLYVDLRLRRIDMQTWIDRSMSVIGSYKRSGGEDLFADLFMVQLYFADGKRTKGYRLLQEMEKKPSRFQTESQYGYYLYLTTFFERDTDYVDQVEKKIEDMLRARPQSWPLQWILLFLQEKYLQSDEAKLEAIRMQAKRGCASPVMYLEAALIYRKNPYILRTLGLFEKKILLYMAKEKMLTEELASHVGNLALQGEKAERKLLLILKSCYQVAEGADCLRAICTLLIDAGEIRPADFVWYEQAVRQDLRINGLYEYYMETMDTVSIEKMPQIIRMYFAYSNALNYHKKAAIFRNISDHQGSIPQIYRTSRSAIENFISEQLSLGRVDQNLAVLYERFVTKKMLTRSLVKNLVRILFTFEVTTKNPMMRSVLVVHDNMNKAQETPLVDGRAKVQIYTPNARIFLVDREGNRYASTSLYRAERFLDSPLLIRYCRETFPSQPELALYFTAKDEQADQDTLTYYKMAQRMEDLTDDFREACQGKVIAYYLEHPREQDTYTYLKSLRPGEMSGEVKGDLLLLMTREGMYEEAFDLLRRFGGERAEVSCLVRICSQTVLAREYEEDEVLLSYCYQCFALGKYDDNILTYLLMYYDGPIEGMKHLWAVGQRNEMDTMTLEEKILMLLLFTRTGSAGTDPIFASYVQKLGRKKLCRAYMNLRAYEYLVKGMAAEPAVFDSIEKACMQGEDVDDAALLALLKYYAYCAELSEEQEERAKLLLTLFAERGMRFAFYQSLPRSLRLMFQLEDKVFVQQAADPTHTLVLSWRESGGEYQVEVMKNVFEGICVREFVLFDTQVIEYYIEEFDDERLLHTSPVMMLHPRKIQENDESRYALLGEMSRLEQAGQWDALREKMLFYKQQEKLAEKIFTLL